MSAYKGHGGPNVSQYIANLNQLSPPQDSLGDTLPPDDDFSAFLNNDFFDVSTFESPLDLPVAVAVDVAVDVDVDVDVDMPSSDPAAQPNFGAAAAAAAALRKQNVAPAVEPSLDFDLNGDFPFTDFSANFASSSMLDHAMTSLPHTQPNPYHLPPQQQQQQHNYPSPPAAISPTSDFDQSAKKRKLDAAAPSVVPQSLDDSARNAAEEDKRRRNTAASARFRVKKKQREQALEKTAKEMSDKATRLEQKVQQLETENAWLKSLITEKSGMHSHTDLKKLLSNREEAAAGRSSPAHTDGVGTDK